MLPPPIAYRYRGYGNCVLVVEETVRVQILVSEIRIEAAVKFFAARPGHQIDHCPRASAVFRLVVRGLHVDFDQRVRRRSRVKLTLAGGIGCIHSVDARNRGTGARAIDAVVDCGVAAGPVRVLSA